MLLQQTMKEHYQRSYLMAINYIALLYAGFLVTTATFLLIFSVDCDYQL